jgi:hypothetical protein
MDKSNVFSHSLGRLGKFASISGRRLTGAARTSGFGQERTFDNHTRIVDNLRAQRQRQPGRESWTASLPYSLWGCFLPVLVRFKPKTRSRRQIQRRSGQFTQPLWFHPR